MTDPAKCVTHYLDACDCQRKRIRMLEAVAEATRGILRYGPRIGAPRRCPPKENEDVYYGRWGTLAAALAALDTQAEGNA
mgnify:CR=1 FL=1